MPTNWKEASDRLPYNRMSRTIANNTTIERNTDGEITLRLHGHPIARFKDGFVTVDDCGWQSVTTKQRLNAILRPNGFSIGAKDFRWYVYGVRADHPEPWEGSRTFPTR